MQRQPPTDLRPYCPSSKLVTMVPTLQYPYLRMLWHLNDTRIEQKKINNANGLQKIIKITTTYLQRLKYMDQKQAILGMVDRILDERFLVEA